MHKKKYSVERKRKREIIFRQKIINSLILVITDDWEWRERETAIIHHNLRTLFNLFLLNLHPRYEDIFHVPAPAAHDATLVRIHVL